jgi:hypothetical protein
MPFGGERSTHLLSERLPDGTLRKQAHAIASYN